MKKMNKAIVLLSGGLDSAISIALLKAKLDIKLALTFNYGQKAFESEKNASKKIAEYYNIPHKIITLDFLKEITNTSLVNQDKSIPTPNLKEDTTSSMKSVWVPNRNGLFINIAGAFCDSFDINYIILGANKEEAKTFSDNSKEFIENCNKTLQYSTLKKPEIITPLINMNKTEIVKKGKELKVPFNLIMSCYNDINGRHCGVCESCQRFKQALEEAKMYEVLGQIFS